LWRSVDEESGAPNTGSVVFMALFAVSAVLGALITPRVQPRVAVSMAATAADAKAELLSIAADRPQTLDDATRSLVNELILQLERSEPTPAPASSSLLNGVWQLQLPGALGKGFFDSPTRELALLLYSAGYSPGTFMQLLGKLPFKEELGMGLGDVSVTIQSKAAGQPRVTTEVTASVFGTSQQLRFFSNLRQISDVRLNEDIVEAELGGNRVTLPGPLARSRTIFVTYLDPELLISRDESGCAEVLLRKQATRFSSSADLSKKGFGDEPQPDTGELFSDGEGPSDMDESADDDVPSD